MAIMTKTSYREDGAEQPSIKAGMFRIRLPFVHAPWEIPEMIQAMVVFVTGVSAVAYLQDIFGLDFKIALAIVTVHELLYFFQNVVGDPIVGGWITPALPLVTTWLLGFSDTTERIQALVMLQLILGILYVVLGVTGLASKLVNKVPVSVKAGILIGAGFSAVIGKYGFMSADNGGLGFYGSPISFSVGVLAALFLLFSVGFSRQKSKPGHKFLKFLGKCGFVPALLLAYVVGMIVGEISLPVNVLSDGIVFNPFPGLKYVLQNFCLVGLGFPGWHVISSAATMAVVAYIISFGDIVTGSEFLEDTKNYRKDEALAVNPNLTNVCCGIRNILQSMFFPTCTLSGPLWSAMMVTICERYKTGKENMYSFFGGCITFNLTKWLCCLILPMVALIRPILPLSMSLTLMIQAFGCFYVALGLCKNNTQRGVAGLIGGVLAITNPQTGLIVGIIVSLVCEWLLSREWGAKKAAAAEPVEELPQNTEE
ncbi:MAG: hypothetical protein IJ206_03825 [Oscillospiraceae bacterium]|nr:hypothetical protein [Oscillospiraceae bacterium]